MTTPARLPLEAMHVARLPRGAGVPSGPPPMLAAQEAPILVELGRRALLRTARDDVDKPRGRGFMLFPVRGASSRPPPPQPLPSMRERGQAVA
jgi:hypothetical protein